MNHRSLVTQFRLAFAWIVIASILATAATYVLAAFLYVNAQYKSVYPANYYERQIPGIDADVRNRPLALLLPSGEEILRQAIQGDGIRYQVVNGEGRILYGTIREPLYQDRAELYRRLNTTVKSRDDYIHTVPLIGDNGQIAGAVALVYQLKPTFAEGGGWRVVAIAAVALLSPFFYMAGFTLLFSRIFVNRINRPLRLLMEASRKIKERDLDFTIPYHADNELGRLCLAFSEMKEELKMSLSAQWKMEQERLEMVEALAHDLKAPLSIIRGYSEALLDAHAGGDAKLLQYLAVIKGNAEKSTNLVQQLQYASDLERSDAQLRLVPVKLSEFLEHKFSQYEVQARRHHIEMTLHILSDNLPTLLIDPDKLERILDNIVSNSLQYTPAAGRIRISVCAEPERIVYAICDSGSGFSPKDMEKAFDKFYRGDEARGSQDGHAGLGLYIVKQLVEQLGGDIRLSRSESGGACVTFQHRRYEPPDS